MIGPIPHLVQEGFCRRSNFSVLARRYLFKFHLPRGNFRNRPFKLIPDHDRATAMRFAFNRETSAKSPHAYSQSCPE
jgi:hypothetical protein